MKAKTETVNEVSLKLKNKNKKNSEVYIAVILKESDFVGVLTQLLVTEQLTLKTTNKGRKK